MTIIEAIKSRKRFKRSDTLIWKQYMSGDCISQRDILAEDWEIEEEKVEVTKAQLMEHWKQLTFVSSVTTGRITSIEWHDYFKALGFKE